MLLHEARVLVLVHLEPALARELACQLDREAVRRLQRERVVPADPVVGGGLFEVRHPALERLGETLLLGGEDVVDLAAVLDELGIRARHLLDHGIREPRQERRLACRCAGRAARRGG